MQHKQQTLDDWLHYFETLHPVGIDMGLARVACVWTNLRQQENIDAIAKQQVITVAGTNGKGSACQMLSLLLACQGYRVGTYTSPHIHHFRERIQISDTILDDSLITRAFEAVEAARGDISLSYFEATTLVGLLLLAWAEVDFAVLEVGLGGRLDAINIIDADAALITSIALDHQAFLGDDLAQIAVEKAGICRPHAPAVYAQCGIYDSVCRLAQQNNIPLLANGRDYQIEDNCLFFEGQSFPLPANLVALGAHQASNCAGVLVLLSRLNLLPVDYIAALSDFALTGRMQCIATRPMLVVDVAHNPAAAVVLSDYLRRQTSTGQRIYAVIGMLADKDHVGVLQCFDGLFEAVFCGRTEGERGFSDAVLADLATATLGVTARACGSLQQALIQAKRQAHPDDMIVAFGSFVVAEALLPPDKR